MSRLLCGAGLVLALLVQLAWATPIVSDELEHPLFAPQWEPLAVDAEPQAQAASPPLAQRRVLLANVASEHQTSVPQPLMLLLVALLIAGLGLSRH